MGTRYTERIELTDLGRDIVYAPNPEVERKKKLEAFLCIELFSKVLDYYKGTALPEMRYLGNTLQREFGLAPEYHDEFSKLFRENCLELGITSGTSLDAERRLRISPIVGAARRAWAATGKVERSFTPS